jgi:hypothetical protein
MIKPIVYHSFEEKEILEKKLLADMPLKRRQAVSAALMSIFFFSKKKMNASNRISKNSRTEK